MGIMRGVRVVVLAALCIAGTFRGADADPALTIYNQQFAVVRDTIKLDLKKGVNSVAITDITAHMEPDSVILRDPTGKRTIGILEQNYRSDPISQGLLLSIYEGKTIDFLVQRQDEEKIVKGKIIRSGYTPHASGLQRYGQQYYQTQMARSYGASNQPVIEVDGSLRFGLPGTPLFPELTDDTILNPTVQWLLEADQAGDVNAELCYITGGMSWEADYNIVSPEKGNILDLVGWITMDNQSGKTFNNAKIKLMAGDVSKLRREDENRSSGGFQLESSDSMRGPGVTEKSFDEYHLYTLRRATTLRDRETKQVEFIRASGIKSTQFYVYDGVKINHQNYRGYSMENIRTNQAYGTQSNPKVWVMREFKNSEDNNLGMPLPRGKLRFYRRDDDGQLEFTGENIIDHTPKDEIVRVYTGNAFDLTGERKRLEWKEIERDHIYDETFEIKLRNHKKEDVEIRVVEHIYRWTDWEITASTHDHLKTDGQTIEYRLSVPKDQQVILNYTVRYRW